MRILVALLLSLLASPAQAQRAYVTAQDSRNFYFNETTGNNANDCRTAATRCKTIVATLNRAIGEYDWGATCGPVIHLPHGQTINGQAQDINPNRLPVNIAAVLVGGGCDTGTFGGIGGARIEIVGDDGDLGSYIFQCPCLYVYQNIVVAHGFTMRGSDTQPPTGNFGVQALGNNGRAVAYNTRIINFGTYNHVTKTWTNQSYGQPYGAGNGGQLYFGNPDFSQPSYTQIDTDSWTFTTQSDSIITVWPGHRFQINAPVHSEYWANPVQTATAQTLGQPLEFAGLGVAGSTGYKHVCASGSTIAFAGTHFPGKWMPLDGIVGNSPQTGYGMYTNCIVNGHDFAWYKANPPSPQ